MTTPRAKKTPRGRPGPVSLFPGKIRAPVTLTLTWEHHVKIRKAMRRLGLTRSDTIGLLIQEFADRVTLPGGKKRGKTWSTAR